MTMTTCINTRKTIEAANGPQHGPVPLPDIRLLSLVDLLAESFVISIQAANDNAAPGRRNDA
jgi:hypothetical protein